MTFWHANFFGGLSEEEIADRLDHMLIRPQEHIGSAFSALFEDGNRDVLDAFRRGYHSSGVGSHTPAAGQLDPASLSVQQLLSHMYKRIDKGIRPALLREARRAHRLAVDGSGIIPLVADLEGVLLRLLDGSLAGVMAGWAPTADDEGSLPVFPWEVGDETAAAFALPSVACRMSVPAPPNRSNSNDGDGFGATEVDGIQLAVIDGYARLLLHGLASFYGIRVETASDKTPMAAPSALPAGDEPTYRIMRLCVPPSRSRQARVERAAVETARRHLAEAWAAQQQQHTQQHRQHVGEDTFGDESMRLSTPSAAAAPSTPAEAAPGIEPLVPLFAVHVRTITDEARGSVAAQKTLAQLQGSSNGGGMRVGGAGARFSYGRAYRRADPADPTEATGSVTSSRRSTAVGSKRPAASDHPSGSTVRSSRTVAASALAPPAAEVQRMEVIAGRQLAEREATAVASGGDGGHGTTAAAAPSSGARGLDVRFAEAMVLNDQ